MTTEQVRSLSYAVRGRVLAKYLGLLAVLQGLLTLVPAAAAVVFGDLAAAGRLGAVAVGLLAIGVPLARLAPPRRLQLNEALTVVLLAFLMASIAMSVPFTGAGVSWLDAWFEAVSSVTTTGLSTAGTVGDKDALFLFTRAWVQWYGGLGFVVLSVALFMRNGIAGRRLMDTEPTGETLVSTTHAYARRVLVVYGALTLAGLAAAWLAIGDGFTALVHILSAVSTGGFSSFDGSLGALGAAGATTISLFAWLGAISLPLYHRAWNQGPQVAWQDPELRVLVLATLAVGAFLAWRMAPGAWLDALLLAMNAQSATGFSPVAVPGLDDASKLVLIGSMLTGGSVGSTAGGIKLLRVLLLLRLLQLTLARAAAPPHALMQTRLGGRRVADDDLAHAALLMVAFAVVLFASWLIVVAHGYPPLDALFEIASATATAGLTAGIARPELEPVLKVLLCFDMLAGRVEIIALLLVLTPGTWIGKRAEQL